MCGRYRLNRDQRRIAEHFELEDGRELDLPLRLPRFNVAPTQQVPVVRLSDERRRELVGLRWGLLPHWSPQAATPYSTINARAETVATKPAFRDPFRRRRCLVPADGFYEWQLAGKKKQPWFIRLSDAPLFAFAGLWDRWQGPDGKVVETFTVLVTAANEIVRPIHERMPVILHPNDYAVWLDVELFDRQGLEALLRPFPPERMEAFPVTTWVNSPTHDDERCSSPADPTRSHPGLPWA